MKLARKILWYMMNLRNLCIACVRIAFYGLSHPNKIGMLFFSFFSSINEFYQFSYGRLYNVEETEFFKELKQNLVFARCNVSGMESVVTRSGETQMLAALVAKLKPRTVFEIGTYNGFTTLHFAYNTPEDATIYTLDLPPDYDITSKKEKAQYSYDDLLVVELSKQNINNRLFKKDTQGKKVKELFGDSLKFDFSPYYGKIDLIFIDGNHSYSFVKSDTENAFKMLSPKGVILWHDFDYIIHRDVFKYLNTLVKTHKIYSIPGTRFAVYGKQFK
jgi:predicted O-methyltransferase YrrM